MPRLKGFRFPREVISYAVWAYHRFALSTADAEDLLAERGVTVRREAIRLWINRFGRHFASCIKRDRPGAADKWHLEEVLISIRGEKYWLWRAVDANGPFRDHTSYDPAGQRTCLISWFKNTATQRRPTGSASLAWSSRTS